MKRLWALFALAALCGALATGAAVGQANPSKIKVGVLLPLTGPLAAVAEPQKQGALLAIDVVNQRGGLAMPWGRVAIEAFIDDDQAKLDVGVRSFRHLMSQGVKGIGGQTWAPLAYAINALVVREPVPYFPLCLQAKEAFQKGKMAPSAFAAAYSPWTVGYMAGTQAIRTLGKTRIFLLARTDSWGWDIRDGVEAAAREFGVEIVGRDEAPLGTSDFTPILEKVRAAKPDVLIAAQFAEDAVALLNQVHATGLDREMTVFNAFITNAVAKAVPPEALRGVYAMQFFYHDMTGFADKPVADAAAAFTQLFRAKFGAPPDASAALAYIAYMEMFRGFEQGQSFDPARMAAALMAASGRFDSIKGPAAWREDHQPEFKYGGFLVKGKGADERTDGWDLFRVEGAMGGSEILPSLKTLGY